MGIAIKRRDHGDFGILITDKSERIIMGYDLLVTSALALVSGAMGAVVDNDASAFQAFGDAPIWTVVVDAGGMSVAIEENGEPVFRYLPAPVVSQMDKDRIFTTRTANGTFVEPKQQPTIFFRFDVEPVKMRLNHRRRMSRHAIFNSLRRSFIIGPVGPVADCNVSGANVGISRLHAGSRYRTSDRRSRQQ